jgi:hypothetical protein
MPDVDPVKYSGTAKYSALLTFFNHVPNIRPKIPRYIDKQTSLMS